MIKYFMHNERGAELAPDPRVWPWNISIFLVAYGSGGQECCSYSKLSKEGARTLHSNLTLNYMEALDRTCFKVSLKYAMP